MKKIVALLLMVVLTGLSLAACGDAVGPEVKAAQSGSAESAQSSDVDIKLGAKPQQTSSTLRTESINTDMFLMDYAYGWTFYPAKTDDGDEYRVLIPDGEERKSIQVTAGYSYADCESGFDATLEELLECTLEELDEFNPTTTEQRTINDVEAVTVSAKIFTREMELILLSVPFGSQKYTTSAVYIIGVPEKVEYYLPVFHEMVATIRAK